jgi:hypothetical protein
MHRRLFLKSAITTCGVVIVGIPNVSLSKTVVRSEPDPSAVNLNHLGEKRGGCAVPGYRYNHHDFFPQDLERQRT